jgi:thymidylate synthase
VEERGVTKLMATHRDYTSHGEAWLDQLTRVAVYGNESWPRGMVTKELLFQQYRVSNPMTFPIEVEGRELRNVIGLIEGLSMIGQISVPEELTRRVKKFGEYADDGILWGSYGVRLHGQLGDLVSRLNHDSWSRQAVLTIFDQRDLIGAKRDIPCTVSLQFLERNLDEPGVKPKLHLKVTMRSNDLWLGTPYDLTQFSILLATIAQVLGVYPGTYTHAVGSSHVYLRDLEKPKPTMRQQKSMAFPLWSAGRGDLGEVVRRARHLLLAPSGYESSYGTALTEFEAWAVKLLS